MREYFGIGFGTKLRIAAPDQFVLKRLIIFDYAIVDQCQLAADVEVRMCVLVGDFAVRSPPCVADPKRTCDRLVPHQFCECRDTSGTFTRFQTPSVYNSDPRRVVASIFKTTQPIEQNGRRLSAPNIANNP